MNIEISALTAANRLGFGRVLAGSPAMQRVFDETLSRSDPVDRKQFIAPKQTHGEVVMGRGVDELAKHVALSLPFCFASEHALVYLIPTPS